MKSCRTPSTLTEYSSAKPGRAKRARNLSPLAVPLRGSAVTVPPSRPTASATTRKRRAGTVAAPLAIAPPGTVDSSHKPSRVASPSSFWNAQCSRTVPWGVTVIARPSPEHWSVALAPRSDQAMGELVGVPVVPDGPLPAAVDRFTWPAWASNPAAQSKRQSRGIRLG